MCYGKREAEMIKTKKDPVRVRMFMKHCESSEKKQMVAAIKIVYSTFNFINIILN